MNFTVALLATALALSMASSVAAESDGGNVFSGVHHAKVVSCSGWKLNRLPEVKRFLKAKGLGFADAYKDLSIEWKSGAPPVMHFYDADDNELAKVDLSNYKDHEIHELLQSNGLQKTEL